MLQSMTGYGKAEVNMLNKHFVIEIKSLNSKQIDAQIKMSSTFKNKEIALRNLISKKLKRGKIELTIWTKKLEKSSNYFLNKELINSYFNQIKSINEELNIDIKDVLPVLLKMPDVIQQGEKETNENEWGEIQKGVNTAISNLLKFRLDEGERLESDIQSRIQKIEKLLTKLGPFSKARIEKVKKNLLKKTSIITTKDFDENRFEQELIYYLEKQDITEELVRMSAHLNYFKKTISSGFSNGKKLGFIGQEIGREINTIGSKSSDFNMQKIVVKMKDELEKIKEQILNIL